jgi:PAS domain S-box-containing protein
MNIPASSSADGTDRSLVALWLPAAVTALLYTICAYIGLSFFVVQPEGVAAVWPASGVLLVALLVYPRWTWPAFLLAAGLANLLVNLGAKNSLPASLGLMTANLAEAMLAALVLQRALGPSFTLNRLRDLLGFVGFAVVGSNTLSALLGAAVVSISFGSPLLDAWRIWWVADGLGMLLIVPAALSWRMRPLVDRSLAGMWRIIEGGLLVLTLSLVSGYIFTQPAIPGQLKLPYPIFPLLIWSALRFRMRGATAAALLMSGIALSATGQGLGPFIFTSTDTIHHILDVQTYLAVIVLSGYIMAAVTSERGQALAALEQSRNTLEQQVGARTVTLQLLNQQLSAEIAEREKAERAVRASEEYFRLLVESLHDYAIYQLSPEGLIMSWNSGAERLKGYSAAAIVGRSFACLYTAEDQAQGYPARALALARADGRFEDEGWRVRMDGSRLWAHTTLSAIVDADGQLRGFAKVTYDSTERRRHAEALQASEAQLRQSRDELEQLVAQRTAELQHSNTQLAGELWTRAQTEATLRESERRYRTVIDTIAEGIVLQGANGAILTCNQAAERILGLTVDQMMGRTSIDKRWRTVREDGTPFPGEEHPAMVALRSGLPQSGVVMGVHTPDGRLTWISINAEPLIQQLGELPYAVVVSFFDLTAHKAAEEQLQVSLAEKDILLREIHHRVKNNLQVISSLLKLQASTLGDPEVRALLLESQQRVRAMALVHEKLYGSRDLARIDFAAYVCSLSGALQRIYRNPGVQTKVCIEGVVLSVDRTMTLGLVLNELISNSFKHAFPQGHAGTIVIDVRRVPGTGLELVVADDGIGLPAEFDPARNTSMGFQVVTILAAQLESVLTWSTAPGARVSLVIPERMLHE